MREPTYPIIIFALTLMLAPTAKSISRQTATLVLMAVGKLVF